MKTHKKKSLNTSPAPFTRLKRAAMTPKGIHWFSFSLVALAATAALMAGVFIGLVTLAMYVSP